MTQITEREVQELTTLPIQRDGVLYATARLLEDWSPEDWSLELDDFEADSDDVNSAQNVASRRHRGAHRKMCRDSALVLRRAANDALPMSATNAEHMQALNSVLTKLAGRLEKMGKSQNLTVYDRRLLVHDAADVRQAHVLTQAARGIVSEMGESVVWDVRLDVWMTSDKPTADFGFEEPYFGCCPVCGGEGMDRTVARKDNISACDVHRIAWSIGSFGLLKDAYPEWSAEQLEAAYAENRAELEGYQFINTSEATRGGPR